MEGPEGIPQKLLAEGIYRLIAEQDVPTMTSLAVGMFPKLQGRIRCFGCDWLGRQFAEDSGRVVDGRVQVLMLDAGAAEVLEIPTSRKDFHQKELKDYADAAVASEFFSAWQAAGGVAPAYGQGVGYRQPLFLGGRDDVSNLEITDIEVYWTLNGQIWRQVQGRPNGTRTCGLPEILSPNFPLAPRRLPPYTGASAIPG